MPHWLAQHPRCGAKTRVGGMCRQPAMPNGRCKMHGGKSTGAPKGNQNAVKHGGYTKEAKAERKALQKLIRDADILVSKIDAS